MVQAVAQGRQGVSGDVEYTLTAAGVTPDQALWMMVRGRAGMKRRQGVSDERVFVVPREMTRMRGHYIVEGDIEALVLRILAKFGMFVLPEKGKPSPYDRSRNIPMTVTGSVTHDGITHPVGEMTWYSLDGNEVTTSRGEYDHLKRIEAAAREVRDARFPVSRFEPLEWALWRLDKALEAEA